MIFISCPLSMNTSPNLPHESPHSLSAQLEVINYCCQELVSIVQFSWDSVRSFARKVVSQFSGTSQDDFLLVDRIIRLVKLLFHHVRHIFHSTLHRLPSNETQALARHLQNTKDCLHTCMRQNKFFHDTFWWIVEQIQQLIAHIQQSLTIA